MAETAAITQEPVQQTAVTQAQSTDASEQQQQVATEQSAQTPEQTSIEQQKIPESFLTYFLVNSKSIAPYLFHSPICKQILVIEDNGKVTATNEYGVSCGNPLQDMWRGNSIPTSTDIAWEKMLKQLELYNSGRKKMNKFGITFENEEATRLCFNREFANALNKYDELRSKKQDNSGSETVQEEQTAQQPEQHLNRAEDYSPYCIEKKDRDGTVIEQPPICNFNILFNRLLKIDDVIIVDGTFNYLEIGDIKGKSKPFTIDNTAFSGQREFKEFFGPFKESLWYDKNHINDLLTDINIDENKQNKAGTIEIIKKTQHFGWDDNFTAYLTPSWDFQLEMFEGMPDEEYGEFVLVDHSRKYSEECGTQEGAPPDFGSVKILNEKITNRIKLGFEIGGNTPDVLTHIKNDLFKLSPIVDRTIPIVFLAPLATILNKLGSSYQAYLQGKSGYGKSQLAILYTNFFAKVDSDEQLVSVIGSTANAAEEIGFYHKDCLFVIDNYKETVIGQKKKEDYISLFGRIADRQGSNRMSASDFGSFRVRGLTLVNGEELWTDASTQRKYDVIEMTETDRINTDARTKCFEQKSKYSGVTAAYIKWLMKNYGNGIVEEIERRIKKHTPDFFFTKEDGSRQPNILLALNMVGYELMLDFMAYNHVVEQAEYESMYNAHLQKLKGEMAGKAQDFEDATNWNKFESTIRNGLTTHQFYLIGDAEYGNAENRNAKLIGRTSRDCQEVAIFKEAFDLIRKANFKLPENPKTIYNEAPDYMIEDKTVRRSSEEGNMPKYGNIIFPRAILLPRTEIKEPVSASDIAIFLPGFIAARLTDRPTAKQYDELILHLEEHFLVVMTAEDKSEKEKFKAMVEPLLALAFKMKYGDDWAIPTQ